MVKADDRRAALLAVMADHVLAYGLEAASLRPLARACGTSDRMLLYYFPDKAALLTAILGEVAARITARLETARASVPMPLEALRRRLGSALLAEDSWPYMRLWLQLAARATQGDAALRRIGSAVGEGFLAWGAAQLDSPDDITRAREAAQLLAAIEGLVLLKSLGMDDACAAALAG